jgi:hypothetical protein
MRSVRLFLLLLVTVVAGGCAHLAPPEADALAKLLQPVPAKAVIYVLRNEPASAPWRMKLTLDGTDMGSTSANTYFRWVVAPGRHIIVSETETVAGLVVDTDPGRIYYVWQEVHTGFFKPRSELKLVDQETAEIALRACYMLEGSA